jgi:hypothetical protein
MLELMNFFDRIKNGISDRIGALFRRRKKPAAPLADRILADALLLGGIPSPAEREEGRAAFVAERLQSFSVPYTIDKSGGVLVRLHGRRSAEPLLLFTGLGSERWNSLESLGRLDTQYTRGAGLADALGPAALLSVAEQYSSGFLCRERDIILFFSASAFDDPLRDAFLLFAGAKERPVAALGIRGLALGSLYNPVLGSRRLEIKLSRQAKEGVPDNALAGALVKMASAFLETDELAQDLKAGVRRIEAQSSCGRPPEEGILELVLESADREKLDGALETIRFESERYNEGELACSLRVISDIPPADPALCRGLCETLKNAMKELKIKVTEEPGADPSSFLVNMGIPALSFGLASGREGLDHDTVEIAAVEKGRLLLERCIELLSKEDVP